MTYLTRLHLNPYSKNVGFDLQNRQGLHRRVMDIIPDKEKSDARVRAGVLYRLETTQQGHLLMIQSAVPLNLDGLPVGYAQATDERNIQALLNWIAPGRVVRYRADVHATRNYRYEKDGTRIPGTRGKRVPLYGDWAESWWTRKSGESGMEVLDGSATFSTLPEVIGWKKSGEKNRRFTFMLTRCEGVAKVTDADLLRNSIIKGIGRGRTYGAGMISIAPIH